MSGVGLAELIGIAVLVLAAWIAKKYPVRISPTMSVVGLVVTIFATAFAGAAVQRRPDLSFPTFAAIYLGGAALSLVFTVLIFAGRWQREDRPNRDPRANTSIRGAPPRRNRPG